MGPTGTSRGWKDTPCRHVVAVQCRGGGPREGADQAAAAANSNNHTYCINILLVPRACPANLHSAIDEVAIGAAEHIVNQQTVARCC